MWIKKQNTFLSLLLLVGCQTQKAENKELDLVHAQYLYFENQAADKRIYLIHGLYGHKEDYSDYPHMRALVDGFILRGYDVVAIQCQPVPTKWRFDGDGSNYESYFLSTFQNNIDEIEAQIGIPQHRYIGGISFGGFHAMLAFSRLGIFEEFFVFKPVTHVQELNPEYAGLNPTRVDPFNNVLIFARAKSFILFDKSDHRVNGTLTSELIDEASPLSSIEVFGTGHGMDMGKVNLFFQWYDQNY